MKAGSALDKNCSLDELVKRDKQNFKKKPIGKKFGGKTLGHKKDVRKGKPHQKDQRRKFDNKNLKPKRKIISKDSRGHKQPLNKPNTEQKRRP